MYSILKSAPSGKTTSLSLLRVSKSLLHASESVFNAPRNRDVFTLSLRRRDFESRSAENSDATQERLPDKSSHITDTPNSHPKYGSFEELFHNTQYWHKRRRRQPALSLIRALQVSPFVCEHALRETCWSSEKNRPAERKILRRSVLKCTRCNSVLHARIDTAKHCHSAVA